MFFDDAPRAFANLTRWLAPGGRFAFAAWGPTADNPWMTSVRDAAAERVEIPTPIPEAPGAFRYAEGDKLLVLLAGAGFGELDVRDWRGSAPHRRRAGAGRGGELRLGDLRILRRAARRAGDDALKHGAPSLTARFAGHQQDGVVRMDGRVHIFTGARRKYDPAVRWSTARGATSRLLPWPRDPTGRRGRCS